jgi:ribosomal protein S12
MTLLGIEVPGVRSYVVEGVKVALKPRRRGKGRSK